ncbi:hypothetical protein BXP70_27975 [Hymenobacter crusticola]|uniref:Thioredoxin domain-containing protein n=1 Tax=Hymenobacter crusticola TaxID=1770526 RepID=A0A243W5A5_9BACT|nr:hypothetical protein BXP70_27975 [Hymenobacter crusticola]
MAACNQEKPTAEIIVEGNIKHIPDGKVYLADAHQYDVILDSAECQNGHFLFKLKSDSSFTPSRVSIHYTNNTIPYDSTNSTEQFFHRLGYRMLAFYNHSKGKDSLKYHDTSFFLEKGRTRLLGDAQSNDIRVFGSRETDLTYSLNRVDFGWLGNLEGEKRAARLTFFKNKIQENPYSYYLLKEIYNAKEQYSEQELREILALFDQEVQGSTFGRKVNHYLANRTDPDQPYPNLSLTGANNQQGWMMDNGAKVNMLVFWASWCGPCRREIPQLKELYADYKDRGVNLVSISIDEKPESWQKALGQEQMGWQQLIADKEQIDLVQQKFNFNAIPFILVADSRGKEIKRFTGYEENNIHLYRTVLEEKLVGK